MQKASKLSENLIIKLISLSMFLCRYCTIETDFESVLSETWFKMAILEIIEFPHPNLRKKAVPVTTFDARLRSLVDDMFETMYEANGIGLAATQVDVHKRLLVLDTSEEKDRPQVFVNPSVDIIEPDLSEYDEGCLSVPGFYETISRPKKIRVDAQNCSGEKFSIEAEGILSVCIQHEIDHLDGKLFVDYLSSLKRNRIRDKLQKDQRSSS